MAYTSIDDPTLYFNTKLYTGNGSTQSITGVGFQPDWLWIKSRGFSSNHNLFDAVRGTDKLIFSNLTNAEVDGGTILSSFDTDGFTLGVGDDSNRNSDTFVAWNWLASNTTASNTDGSITSTVSANTTSGFSIVSYDGEGSAGDTVGHGLGTVPKMMIFKRLETADNWTVYHSSIGATKRLRLNTTDAEQTSSSFFNDTEPTSSVFTLGSNNEVNGSAEGYIAYCFAEKQGYSKFGSYTGNGNADGTFIYTGFKPAFLMIKKSSASGTNWIMKDNKRSGTSALQDFGQMNPNQTENPSANLSNAENKASAFAIDILSNGFKLRGTDTGINNSGDTYIYIAIAESPFVTGASGIPTTAR